MIPPGSPIADPGPPGGRRGTREEAGLSPARLVAGRIGPGEELRWSGRPRQGVRWKRADALLFPFSLVCFLAAAGLAWWSGTSGRGGYGLPAAGGVLALFGLYAVLGRFFVDARRRRGTSNGLTGTRAVILGPGKSASIDLADVVRLSLESEREGRGTILFETAGRRMLPRLRHLLGSGLPGAGFFHPPAFEEIEGAREVHRMILERMAADPEGRRHRRKQGR